MREPTKLRCTRMSEQRVIIRKCKCSFLTFVNVLDNMLVTICFGSKFQGLESKPTLQVYLYIVAN